MLRNVPPATWRYGTGAELAFTTRHIYCTMNHKPNSLNYSSSGRGGTGGLGGRVGPTGWPATVLCSSWYVLNSISFRSPSPFYTPLPGWSGEFLESLGCVTR